MQVDVIDSAEGLAALEEEWRAVYAADPEAQYFLSWPWMSYWLTTAVKQWVVLAARSDEEPSRHVAFLALRPVVRFRKGVGLVTELAVACQGLAVYTGLIADPASEADAIPAIAARLKDLRWADLRLENFDMSDERFALLQSAFPAKTFRVHGAVQSGHDGALDMGLCPRLDLPGDWDSYLNERLGTNTRQKMRRFLRKVDEADDFTITEANAETFERDLDILLDLWGSKWDEEKGTDAEDIKKVNRLTLTRCFEDGALFLPVIWQGDRPLGALAIVVDREKKTYLFKITGRDETFKGPPTGIILHAYAIRHAIRNGMRVYDFLPGNDSYKYQFGPRDHQVRNLSISTKSRRNLNRTLDPRDLARAVKLAEQLRRSGQAAAAERAYRQILETDARHEPAMLGLVSLLQAKGDAKGAQKLMASIMKASS